MGRRFFQGVLDGPLGGHGPPLFLGRLEGRLVKRGPRAGFDALVEGAIGPVVGVAAQPEGGYQGLRRPEQARRFQRLAPRPGHDAQALQDVGDVSPVSQLLGGS